MSPLAAEAMVSRKLPAPESAVFVTVRVAAEAAAGKDTMPITERTMMPNAARKERAAFLGRIVLIAVSSGGWGAPNRCTNILSCRAMLAAEKARLTGQIQEKSYVSSRSIQPCGSGLRPY